jgi:hypothetical protein
MKEELAEKLSLVSCADTDRLEALVGAEAEADVVGGPLSLGVAELWAQGFSDFSDIGGSFGGRQG